MREVGLGVAAMIVLVVVGTHVWGGPIPMLWVHALAHECADGPSTRRCVDHTDATVLRHTPGETTADLLLDVPERGELPATLSAEDAGRLAVAVGDRVRVKVLHTEVLRIAGENGETVTTVPRLDLTEALLRFLAVSAGSIVAVFLAGFAWHRGRGGSGWWLRPAAGSMAVGTALGLGAAAFATHDVAMPVLFGVTAVGSLAAAYVWQVHIVPARA